MTSTMQQRRDEILSLAYQSGHVSVRKIADRLDVSEATVRRDLHELADEGLLQLTHGGASVTRNSDYSFLSKSTRNLTAKKVIAEIAADIIHNGDQIFLDSGTTCFVAAPVLRGKKQLSVIVNSVRTAQELHSPSVDVLLLGGQFRQERMDTVGPIAIETLEHFRGYRAFLGADGISMDFGLTSVDVESAHINKLASSNAQESILLADSSKFDNPKLYKIMDFANLSMVISEKEPPVEWMKFFDAKEINVLYSKQTRVNE
ncbi:MAG: DeoR/GlpR family DNA-binding transcription regulator [Planctomycetota bacterium]|jgi:DeoR family fructose operon transcriptional repressor